MQLFFRGGGECHWLSNLSCRNITSSMLDLGVFPLGFLSAKKTVLYLSNYLQLPVIYGLQIRVRGAKVLQSDILNY